MRVLIVDDSSLGIDVLQEQILKAEPAYKIEGVTTANEARRLVQEVQPPFDVFLIDQNLGLGPNGVELLIELHQLSPRSDAMVFTGYGDSREGQRAIAAGACDFFTKPIDHPRLLAQLRRLQRERSIRDERNWLQLLAVTAEELQQATTIQSVGQAIVKGVQRLGFRRARLRMVCEKQSEQLELIGVSQIGNPGLTDDFTTTKRSLAELPYSRRALTTRKPTLFHGRELGDAPWDEYIGPPTDEWFKVPLLIGNEPIGTLSLDNGAYPCKYSVEEQQQLQQLLDLFGKQAAAALERARLHERANLQAQETQILSDIGRAVTTQAAQGKLDALLETIREQIGKELGLDISNFTAVLLDEGTDYLDFRCHYKRGAKQPRGWRKYPSGLVGHMIQSRTPLLLPNGLTRTYREMHQIDLYGTPSQCWLGAPLLVEDQVIGALVVQSYDNPHAYNEYHKQVLVAVADQVAGAVEAAYRYERDRERTRQLETLHRIAAELPRLARDDEDRFWHTILTVITHRDGLSLNRAVLFLYDEESARLRGRLGIGAVNRQDARRAWERDEETGWSLEDYLKAPYLGRLAPTRLEEISRGWEIMVSEEENPFRQVWITGEPRVISAPEHVVRWLPKELARPEGLTDDSYPLTTAFVPLKLDSRVLGIVVVDNAFDGEPLSPTALTNLEDLLSQAARALDQAQALTRNQHQSELDRAILRLTQQVTVRVRERPLKESLEDFAREAKALTNADLVVIYPLQQDGGGYATNHVAAIGLLNEQKFRATNNPRQQGVTGHILRAGTLVVPDVRRNDLTFDGNRLSDHPFLLREEIRAFIGVPIHEPTTGKRLGVLYLDYRSPQPFAKSDVALAEDLAQAIATGIRAERDVGGREAAEAALLSRELELTLLRGIQEEALSPDTDERKVITATLKNGAHLFELDALLRIGMLAWETADRQARPVWHEFSLDTLGRLSHHRTSEAHRKIMGRALESAKLQQDGRLFVIPIRLSKRVIGAIQIEFSDATHFTMELAQRAERLATAVALALDNVRRLDRFRAVLEAAKAVTEPSDLQALLGTVVAAAQDAAPGIECVTLWYEDPTTKKLLAGPQWGLIGDPDTQVQEGTPAGDEGLVRRVMRAIEPIWAEDIREGPFRGDFSEVQKIVSTAVFPLRVGKERVGALFFSYRQPHIFTPEERELFPIFAAIAAASLQDARKTQYAEQKQLEAERDRASLEAAARVSAAVGTSLDLPTVLENVIDELHNRFKLQGNDPIPYVMLYDSQAEVLEFAPSAIRYYTIDNPDFQGLTQLSLRADIKSVSVHVARETLEAVRNNERETIVKLVNDIRAEGFVQFRLDTKSELCAGLVSNDRFLGVLVLKEPRVCAFTAEDKQLFKLVAEQVALAIDRADRAASARRDATVAGAMAWAADLAHDINSDVGLIRRLAERLGSEGNLSEEGKELLRQIDTRAAQLADTARDARSARGDLECFALDEMLQERCETWALKSGVNLSLQVIDQPITQVTAHREQVWRLIRQILRNAAEAMNYRGKIMVRLLPGGPYHVELQIEDSGPGIPDDVRQHIFREPFSTRGRTERGFGLLMTRWLVESMGGSIRLLPYIPKQGAVFAIRLPVGHCQDTPTEEHNGEHAAG